MLSVSYNLDRGLAQKLSFIGAVRHAHGLLEYQLTNRHTGAEPKGHGAVIDDFQLDCSLKAGVNRWRGAVDCETHARQAALALNSTSDPAVDFQINSLSGPGQDQHSRLEIIAPIWKDKRL